MIADLFNVQAFSKVIENDSSNNEIHQHIGCDNRDPKLSYFVENSWCYNDFTIYGDHKLKEGANFFQLVVREKDCQNDCESLSVNVLVIVVAELATPVAVKPKPAGSTEAVFAPTHAARAALTRSSPERDRPQVT